MLERNIIEGSSNPKGICLGIRHEDDYEIIRGLTQQLPLLKKMGFTHIGLEIFKSGSIGKVTGVDEAVGFEKYTSGTHDERDKDVQCLLLKAERVDVRNYCREAKLELKDAELANLQAINIKLQEMPNSIAQANSDLKAKLAIYREGAEKSQHQGYRELLQEMKKHQLTGIGIDSFVGNRETDDNSIIDGNRYFISAINSVNEKSPNPKMFIICGAMHTVQYKTEKDEISPGMALQFGFTPLFYNDKAKEAVKSFPKKIDIEQVKQIPIVNTISGSTLKPK